MPGIEVQGVGAESGGFAPAQPSPGRSGDDRPVPVGGGGQQTRQHVVTIDDPFVVIVFTVTRKPDALTGIKRDETVTNRRPQHSGGKLVTFRNNLSRSPFAQIGNPCLHSGMINLSQ